LADQQGCDKVIVARAYNRAVKSRPKKTGKHRYITARDVLADLPPAAVARRLTVKQKVSDAKRLRTKAPASGRRKIAGAAACAVTGGSSPRKPWEELRALGGATCITASESVWKTAMPPRRRADAREAAAINRHAAELNAEMVDALSFQTKASEANPALKSRNKQSSKRSRPTKTEIATASNRMKKRLKGS
jgi:hypothetical protein